MSLILAESWDGTNGVVADLAGKWTTLPANALLSTTNARHDRCFSMNNLSTQVIDKSLASTEQHATVIIGTALRVDTTPTTETQFLRFFGDGGTTGHVGVYIDTSRNIRVFRGTNVDTQLGTSSSALPLTTYVYVEVKVVLSSTVGSVQVRVDGVSVLNITGTNTKNGGTGTVFDMVRLAVGGTGSTSWWRVDDTYICNAAGSRNNDFLGDSTVSMVRPLGNGNYAQWVGSDADSVNNYLHIDEATASDVDYIESSTAGNKDTHDFANVSSPGSASTVAAVQVTSRAFRTDTGTAKIRHVARSAGSDATGPDVQPAITTGQAITTVFELDPASTPWTFTTANAADFGVEYRT